MKHTSTIIQNRSFQLLLFFLSMLGFIYVLVVNAWVVDDAYITFRTVDNFVKGYGLRWNIDERVQVYTHPLWMFIISFFYFFTSEVFYTSIVISFLLSLSTIVVSSISITNGFRVNLWKLPLLILGLVSSKAFIDYTSSGLENALSYLIAAIFYSRFLYTKTKIKDFDLKDLSIFFFLASIAFFNRNDSLLLYLPVLIYLIIVHRAIPIWKLARVILLSTLPASLWILFSLIYYGFPLPNTVYAKVITTGYPVSWKVLRGLEYISNSILWDSASYAMLIVAFFLCWKDRSTKALVSIGGVLLYIMFVILQAASATHMSGRFFAVPFFLTVFILVERITTPRFGLVTAILLIGYIVWTPVSAIKFGTSAYQPYSQRRSYIDTKWYVYKEGAALINWKPGKRLPDHAWYHYGERIRSTESKVHVGGAFGRDAIGYMGFAAGPDKFIIDKLALGDPLLARMPAILQSSMQRWRPGHFRRVIPEGYIESVFWDKNLIKEPALKLYYAKIRNITRGSIFSLSRLKDIWNINIGRYDYLLQHIG